LIHKLIGFRKAVGLGNCKKGKSAGREGGGSTIPAASQGHERWPRQKHEHAKMQKTSEKGGGGSARGGGGGGKLSIYHLEVAILLAYVTKISKRPRGRTTPAGGGSKSTGGLSPFHYSQSKPIDLHCKKTWVEDKKVEGGRHLGARRRKQRKASGRLGNS